MTTTFTVSGGNGAAPVSISANDTNASIDPVLIAAIDADVAAGILVPQDAPPDPFVPMPPLGGYTILRDGGSVNAVGQQAIVAADGAPATITGGGTTAQTVISGTGGLTFSASSGNTTIAAGGTGNAINLQGGTNTLYADSGADSVTANSQTVVGGGNDTITAASGSNTISGSGNTINLDGGSNAIAGTGDDTIMATAGSETIASAYAGRNIAAGEAITGSPVGDIISGGASRLTFISPLLPINDHQELGGSNTILGGTGSDTIYGAGLLAGGAAGNNFIAGSGIIFGGGSGDQLFATGGLEFYSNDLLVAGAGNETLSASSEDGSVVMFAGNNTITANGAPVTANDTMGGGTSSLSQTFFAGTGDAVMIAGPTIYGNIPGEVPRTDLFAFVNGRAGGTDAIEGFNASSRVTLQGYAPNAVAASLATATVAGGSTAITLPDHTTILFVGVTDLTAGAFV